MSQIYVHPSSRWLKITRKIYKIAMENSFNNKIIYNGLKLILKTQQANV